MEDFFLYCIYLPGLFLARAIVTVCGFLLPEKVLSFFRMKQNLPDFPKFSERPILIHAASGEIEYAKELIRLIKKSHPHLPIVVSYSSPSAEPILKKMTDLDFFIPLVLDSPQLAKAWLRKLHPRAVLVAKTDFWPFFLKACKALEIPTSLVTFTASTPLSLWQRTSLRYFSDIFAANTETEQHVLAAGLRCTVTGDTRIDQALFRRGSVNDSGATTGAFQIRLVAGSVWPPDIQVIKEVIPQTPQVQYFLVPHEIHEPEVQALRNSIKALGISCELWSEQGPMQSQVVIVNAWGQLADLYRTADMAFIGGSFQRKVHSVMEALVWGCPVVVGPFYRNNFEAVAFSQKNFNNWPAVLCVNTSTELKAALEKFLAISSEERRQMKNAIRNTIESESGASLKIFTKIQKQITSS